MNITNSPEAIISFHRLMKFTIDQSIFAFHSDLEVILLDVNSQHFGFKLTARNTKILR